MSAIVEENIQSKNTVIQCQCNDCTRKEKGKASCLAFNKIPQDILDNTFIHTEPYEGDNGIMYRKKKD